MVHDRRGECAEKAEVRAGRGSPLYATQWLDPYPAAGVKRRNAPALMTVEPIRIPEEGTIIGEAYRVVGELGSGGMGVVLRAVDIRLNREVAIKLVAPSFASLDEHRERIVEEARAMATVRHENVVSVYAVGELDGMPYFVMELVPGNDLCDWLASHDRQGQPPSLDEVLGILDQICRGLTAIHDAGIVHGDVKPGNVLLGPAFRVAVTDFGLYRAMGGVSDDGMVVGTPAYIAPEVVKGTVSAANARMDIYAVGVLAYEMLTGRVPRLIRTHGELFTVHRENLPLTPITDLRTDVPASFDAAVSSALESDPDRRPPTIEALRRAMLSARQRAAQRAVSMRILVADDDPDFLAFISEALGFAFPGSAIECVADGAAALRSLEGRRADLAVIDLDMPELNGVELTAAIRARRGLEGLPILVVTARGGAPDWQLLQRMGANGFLVKPLDPYALITMARRAVGEPSA